MRTPRGYVPPHPSWYSLKPDGTPRMESDARSSSLDPQEPKSQGADPSLPECIPTGLPVPSLPEVRWCDDQWFRHSGWRTDRLRVYLSLCRTFGDCRRAEAFRHCGTNAWVLKNVSQPGKFRLAANYCHDRFCRPCSVARSNLIAGNLRGRIRNKPHRFVTLTLRQTDQPLHKCLDRLYFAFAKLRRSSLWQEAVYGGVACLELTRGQKNDHWHVHLHCIVSGKFLPQDKLSDAWLRATGDSPIVDVRMIGDHERTVRYVAKYAAKGLDASILRQQDVLDEAVEALHKRRLALTFGDWRGVQLTRCPKSDDWQPLMPLQQLRLRALDGDQTARCILRDLHLPDAWLLTQCLLPEDVDALPP